MTKDLSRDVLSRFSNVLSTNNVFESFFNDFFSVDFPTNWVEISDFPKTNIIDISDENKKAIKIQMALAGYSKDDVIISTEDNVLTIESKANFVGAPENYKYITKGIAERNFKWQRTLPKYSEVVSQTFKNGILEVEIVVNIPEEKKRKVYNIE